MADQDRTKQEIIDQLVERGYNVKELDKKDFTAESLLALEEKMKAEGVPHILSEADVAELLKTNQSALAAGSEVLLPWEEAASASEPEKKLDDAAAPVQQAAAEPSAEAAAKADDGTGVKAKMLRTVNHGGADGPHLYAIGESVILAPDVFSHFVANGFAVADGGETAGASA